MIVAAEKPPYCRPSLRGDCPAMRLWFALLLPWRCWAEELAVVRWDGGTELEKSFRRRLRDWIWNSYPPCQLAPAVPVDLVVLQAPRSLSSTLDVIHSSGWRHCFRDVLARPLENRAGPSASSLRRNGVFRRLLSDLDTKISWWVGSFYAAEFTADYDAFFFMEIDAVPVRPRWMDQLLLEVPRASAIRGSGYRGDLFEGPFGAEMLEIRYVNGNAIYNLRHPWLRWLHAQLEKEAEVDALASIDFDVRMGNLTMEAQRGSKSNFRGAYSALVAPGEEPYRSDSRLIGSFGNALLNHSFESGVYVRQASLNRSLVALLVETNMNAKSQPSAAFKLSSCTLPRSSNIPEMSCFLMFVLFAIHVIAQQDGDTWLEGNGSAPQLRSGTSSTLFNKDSCKTAKTLWTIPSGWKTKKCRKTVCVSADPGYIIDSTTLVVGQLDCRGRRDPCCGQPYTVNVKIHQIGNVTLPIPVEIPEKACVHIQAEGAKKWEVTGRGECSIRLFSL
eukprot:s1429_g9.t1